MTWAKSVRSQFVVYILASDVDLGARLKAPLTQEGFDSYLLTDMDSLVERLKSDPCHVLVFTLGSLAVTLEDFVKGILLVAPEVQFVPVVQPQERIAVLAYREYQFRVPVVIDEALTPVLTWTVDETCREIYSSYQNEQLLERSRTVDLECQKLQSELQKSRVADSGLSPHQLSFELEIYDHLFSKAEAMTAFLGRLSKKFSSGSMALKAIYFKYMPTIQSFVVLQSLGLDSEAVQGLGGKLSPEEQKDLKIFFQSQQIPAQIDLLLRNGLKAKQYLGQALFVDAQLDGFFVFWSDNAEIQENLYAAEFLVFKMVYQNIHLHRLMQGLDLPDPVTELQSKPVYLKKLFEEVSRSRRHKRGVSVIKVAIDNPTEIQQIGGEAALEQALKILGSIAAKTSRVNDIVCRTGENEISLILSMSGRKGAALRAERLRRLAERNFHKTTGQFWTVSCGVAEFPSHCRDLESLETCSVQALEFVQSKGFNKVCLYQPAKDFEPEFEVPPN